MNVQTPITPDRRGPETVVLPTKRGLFYGGAWHAAQAGNGREECIEELLAFTQEKKVHVNLKRPA